VTQRPKKWVKSETVYSPQMENLAVQLSDADYIQVTVFVSESVCQSRNAMNQEMGSQIQNHKVRDSIWRSSKPQKLGKKHRGNKNCKCLHGFCLSIYIEFK